MKNLIKIYEEKCKMYDISFEKISSIKPYDDTTLFTIAGMQKYKPLFSDINYKNTVANVQSCIRLNDLDNISDGIHLLHFNMIGFFSFREKTIQEVVDFWYDYIVNDLELILDYVTIHPDKTDWIQLYEKYDVEVRFDEECIWNDGSIGGYCTEFYSNGIEIGNIVNPLGDCIDVGFSQERLNLLVNGIKLPSETDILKDTINIIIESGYKPSANNQGYILRKLIRKLYMLGGSLEHQFFNDEIDRQIKIDIKYHRLKDKYSDKSKQWWWDTHGIDITNY